MMSLANGLKKVGTTDPDKLAAAFKGLKVDTPFGPIVYRSQDNQSTMGAYVGVTGLKDGKGVMSSFHYVDGASVQPTHDGSKKASSCGLTLRTKVSINPWGRAC